jgi:hypothetical protein
LVDIDAPEISPFYYDRDGRVPGADHRAGRGYLDVLEIAQTSEYKDLLRPIVCERI